ncbi:MAG: NADH-quinone oxidoreductase subunit L [Cyclobacteriaceae bacterium]|nr:NADH-quinone oxidoreductase subunit L [Cyclobacteriaceae bacterium]
MNPDADIAYLIVAASMIVLSTPLVSGILSAMVPVRYSWLVSLTASFMLLLAVAGAVLLAWTAGLHETRHFSTPWFTMGERTVSAGILIDKYAVVMVLVVTIVSFLVHVYSAGYMAGDGAIRRYFVMLGFFTFTMLGIVLSDNLLILFMCWELVGFSSYMLIGHWMELPDAAHASRKAYMMNRVGDLGFVAGLMIVYRNAGTFDITALASLPAQDWETAAALCFFLAIAAKSAQFPLLTWLPDAMAGPTPVSALIHAATMVAAGVFLLARIHFLFPPPALMVVTVAGLATALTGAAAALGHFDIKKILAYSTVSQLGLMITALGAGAKDPALLHLLTHAFFKAGLFLAAGAIIHTLHQVQRSTGEAYDVQDIRNLGGLQKVMPVTFGVFILCGASLSGIPMFSGFQSKEAILAHILNGSGMWAMAIASGVLLTTFLTVVYTFRLIWFVFVTEGSRSERLQWTNVPEVPFVMRFPMIVLGLASLWWIVSLSPFSFSGWFMTGNADALTTLVSVGVVLVALAFAVGFFRRKSAPPRTSDVFTNTFYLDALFTLAVTRPVGHLSSLFAWVDRKYIDGFLHGTAYAQVTLAHIVGWIDRAIVDGLVNFIARLTAWSGALVRTFQSGNIHMYIFWAGMGLVLLTLYIVT